MSIQGSLKDIQLADVVQLVSSAGKSGMFLLRRGSLEGRVYIQGGRIVHAELGDLQGEDAIYEMALWNEGNFVFHPDVKAPQVTIQRSNVTLFMEAARRVDEWRVLSRKIPSVDLIPEVMPTLPQGRSHVQLNTGEWVVLAHINGQRTIRDIARLCNMSLFDTAKILYGLVTHNLVRLRTPKPTPARMSDTDTDTGAIRRQVSTHLASSSGGSTPRTAQLLAYLERVRQVTLEILGPEGLEIIEPHYEKAREAVQAGSGVDVLREAVVQVLRETARRKGTTITNQLLEQIKQIKL